MGNVKEKFTIPRAAKILGIENNRIREFVSRNYIKVAYPAPGHGSKNFLNRSDLYQVKLFLSLLERGFLRIEASRVTKSVYAYLSQENLSKLNKHLMFACFRRAVKDNIMKRKDIDKPHITDQGQIVSNKGPSPGVRIITDADLEKSFATLFMTFDDDESSKKYDYSSIDFEDIIILNMKDIIAFVDSRL